MKRIKFFLTKMFGQQKIGAEKGFTLAEIMVTAGIVAVLAVAIMRMNSMAQKTSKTTAQSLEITQLYGRAQQVLSDPVSCAETFKTKAPTAGGIQITKIIRMAKGTPDDVIGAGNNCVVNTTRPGGTSPCISGVGTQGKIGLYQMVFKKVSGGADNAATGILEMHFVKGVAANSSWDFSSASKQSIQALSSYGSNYAVKKIPVDLILQANVVIACYTNEDNFLEKACTNLGGTYNTAATPACTLPATANPTNCRDVAIAAVGSVSYGSIAVGNNTSMCDPDEIVRGINTITTVVETSTIESSPIGFTRLQLILKCCKKP